LELERNTAGQVNMRLSIVVPVLNEADGIARSLDSLQPLRRAGHEVIVVDGNSSDLTIQRAMPLADKIVTSPAGRSRQMNAGAAIANGDVILFLHADSVLPESCVAAISAGIDSTNRGWGRFNIRLTGDRFLFRVVEWFMNTRSRLTGIATGDQGIFVEQKLFDSVGGFPDIPLMEDVALSVSLKQIERPICLKATIATSSRRWEQHGAWPTIWLMWRLRYAYWRGADPSALAKIYYPNRSGV
jgi:rSAM/selenodomain-associated transferase 2